MAIMLGRCDRRLSFLSTRPLLVRRQFTCCRPPIPASVVQTCDGNTNAIRPDQKREGALPKAELQIADRKQPATKPQQPRHPVLDDFDSVHIGTITRDCEIDQYADVSVVVRSVAIVMAEFSPQLRRNARGASAECHDLAWRPSAMPWSVPASGWLRLSSTILMRQELALPMAARKGPDYR